MSTLELVPRLPVPTASCLRLLLQPLSWDADCSHHEGGEELVMEDTSIGASGLLEAVMMCPIQRGNVSYTEGGRLSTKRFLLYGLV